MKVISYHNRELRWLDYGIEWGEQNLTELKKYLAHTNLSPRLNAINKAVLDTINEYSWDDIVDDWSEYKAGSHNLIMVVYPPSIGYSPDPLASILDDYINEDAWDADAKMDAARVDFKRIAEVVDTDEKEG